VSLVHRVQQVHKVLKAHRVFKEYKAQAVLKERREQ
jgi:hypothetical protein